MSLNISERVAARYRSAIERPNPLNGMRKNQAVKFLYKVVGRIPDGIFRDNSWVPIHQIFKVLQKNNIGYGITDTQYHKNQEGVPNAKTWTFEIPFLNERGRDHIIYGRITAAGAGTVKDPLDSYDVTVTFG